MAHARLQFANGCVANLNASRVSFESHRRMQIFAEQAYAAVDFARGEAMIVQPNELLLRRQLDVHQLSQQQQDRIKTGLFDELLQLKELPVPPQNAILEEQREFAAAIRSAGRVRVSGEEARKALHAAQQILAAIDQHRWTAEPNGPAGPRAIPIPSVVPAPHWPKSIPKPARQRRKAG
jgi:predicted dehydrogenase